MSVPGCPGSVFSLLDRNFDGELSAKDFERLATFNADKFLLSLEQLKTFAQKSFGGIDQAYQKFLAVEHAQQKASAPGTVPRDSVSFKSFEKVCAQHQFSKALPDADLRMLFLFLDEASGKRSNGQLTKPEWSLLKSFDCNAVTGHPARLRKFITDHYGGVDEAFQAIHTSWLKRALMKGLKQLAIAGMARALLRLPDAGSPSGNNEPSSQTSLADLPFLELSVEKHRKRHAQHRSLSIGAQINDVRDLAECPSYNSTEPLCAGVRSLLLSRQMSGAKMGAITGHPNRGMSDYRPNSAFPVKKVAFQSRPQPDSAGRTFLSRPASGTSFSSFTRTGRMIGP